MIKTLLKIYNECLVLLINLIILKVDERKRKIVSEKSVEIRESFLSLFLVDSSFPEFCEGC